MQEQRHSPRPRSRNPRGEGGRLRDDLVAAGRRLLAAADAESDVSIRGVTRAAGVTPQAFYLHFATIDELLFAVYTAEFAELMGVLQAAKREVEPGEAALRAMCDSYVAFARERPAQYRLMTSTRGTLHEDWDASRLPGAQLLALLRDALVTAARGERGSLAPEVAVVQLWVTLHGIVSLRESRPTFPWPPLDDMVRQAVDSALVAVGRAR